MAVSSGLSRVLLGLGQGYLNARNQGRRERQNLITTQARLKSDRQRNAIEMAKLTSAEEDRRLRREADANALGLQNKKFEQDTLGNVGLELDRGMKRLEGRTGADLDTGIHQLRGSIMNLYGRNQDRPFGITQQQLDTMLAAPGSIIPGVTERKIGAGDYVNQNYGADPTTQFYDPQSIMELYGENTPKVGESMAVRPEGSRNFLEFANTPIDETTRNLMGLMGQGAAKYYGGQMNMPQNFDQMMAMKPQDMLRSPEDVQRAVNAQIPESVMISREREPTAKDVPVRASYGMKATDEANIEAKRASAGLTQARTTSVLNKLEPEIALMNARIGKIKTDTRLAPLKQAASMASQALARARLSLAAIKENNLMTRHKDMMGYRGAQLGFDMDQEQNLNVRSVFNAVSDLDKSIMMAKQEKARLITSPNFNAKDPSQQAALKEMDQMIGGLENQAQAIHTWGVAQTGSPQEWANIAATGNYYANQGFLTDNPLLQAMGHSMQSRPAAYGTMGTTHGYDPDRFAGLYMGMSDPVLNWTQRMGRTQPDSPGMAGGPGFAQPKNPANPAGGKQGGGPKPSPKSNPKPAGKTMTREELLNAHFAALKGGK